mgnify:CR=1 FL=1
MQLEIDQFRDAQAGGVEHFEQAIEPQRAQLLQARGLRGLCELARPGQHAVDIRDRKHLRQAAAALGAGQDRGGIVAADALVEQEAEEVAHRRQPPRHAGGLETARVEVGKIVAQPLRISTGEGQAGMAQEFREVGEVAPIGLQRIVAGALFGREHVEEQGDQLRI